jgi:beta-hydroxylase
LIGVIPLKVLIVIVYLLSIAYVHLRGRVRHKLSRQLTDHSSFLAPVNAFLYLVSSKPSRPFLDAAEFPELKVLQDHWEEIRTEGQTLLAAGAIKKSDQYDDVGFNSFFKTGWKRFYLKWYGDSHPSAMKMCPRTTELVQSIGSVKAAMFAELPPGAKLVRHRDPYAGSYRYHLGLETPNSPECYIDVDGERYHWRDGEAVVFDETYIHYAENTTEQNRLILFCDVERPLKYGWAAAFNRWFSRTVVAAAGAPNDAGDKTGALNRLFGKVYALRLRGKSLKKRNRMRYNIEKWGFFGGLLLIFILI